MRSRALPPILTRRPGLRKQAHPFTLTLKDDKQCIPRVSCIVPCFLLSSPRFVFPIGFLYTLHSFHNNYLNLALFSSSALGSRQLVCIDYYLVLRFLPMYSSSSLSTDVFS